MWSYLVALCKAVGGAPRTGFFVLIGLFAVLTRFGQPKQIDTRPRLRLVQGGMRSL